MSGLKVWEFADTLQALYDTREGADDPAIIAEIDKAIEQTFTNIAQKVDGMYEFLSRSESEAERLGKEIKNLQGRKKAMENRAESVENRLMDFMKFHEQMEMKGEIHRLYRALNPEALNVTDPEVIPARFVIVNIERKLDNAAIKIALKAGTVVPGAELTRGERIGRK